MVEQRSLQMTAYSGPLPDPSTLAEFERIVPGSAEQIITRFVEQGRHRQTLEFHAVKDGSRNELAATIVGGIVAVVALSVCGMGFYFDQGAAALGAW